MSSAERPASGAGTSLRDVAREAVERGVREGREPVLEAADYEPSLRRPGASFVTLRRGGELRGCTGSLEASLPLVADVARNAWRSANRDPRFPPLAAGELVDLEIAVSVLSALEPLPAGSEAELLVKLRAGVDGLVLHEGSHVATFLPSVWESLPEPRAFLDALRHKARLPHGHWSSSLRFARFTTTDAP
jgi:AmmeMemoRadiSam system protein A